VCPGALPGPQRHLQGVEREVGGHSGRGAPPDDPSAEHVTEQRRVMGRRRIKTDAIGLETITELALAGRGQQLGDAPGCWASWRGGRATAADVL
jgi:hypothetical protein